MISASFASLNRRLPVRYSYLNLTKQVRHPLSRVTLPCRLQLLCPVSMMSTGTKQAGHSTAEFLSRREMAGILFESDRKAGDLCDGRSRQITMSARLYNWGFQVEMAAQWDGVVLRRR